MINFNSSRIKIKKTAVSIGNFINISTNREINKNFDSFVIEDPLYMHEYGHTFQSQIFGLSYLFAIGLPSAISAKFSEKGKHIYRPYESQANRYAASYFEKHFGVDWTDFKIDYPL
ncbi:MAG: hypothetical protein ACK5H1_10165 [Tenacibaculum sp.]